MPHEGTWRTVALMLKGPVRLKGAAPLTYGEPAGERRKQERPKTAVQESEKVGRKDARERGERTNTVLTGREAEGLGGVVRVRNQREVPLHRRVEVVVVRRIASLPKMMGIYSVVVSDGHRVEEWAADNL